MNILFFMNHYPDSRNGGIENVTRILSEQFVELGHSVHIRYLYDSMFDHSEDAIFKSCIQIDRSNILTQIGSAVDSYNIDFVINQSILSKSHILKKAIEGLDCKLITVYHNKPTLEPPTVKDIIRSLDLSLLKKIIILFTYPLFAYRSRIKLKRCHQRSYLVSDYTALLSKQFIPEYTKIMDVVSDKLVFFNNPIRDELISSLQDLEEKENTVLMVTRLDEKQKCIIKALKIWEKVNSDIPNWKLQIVGSGPDEMLIKNYACKNNIKNVEFYSAQDPIEFYRKSSIFLMTSRSEGWGCTLTEAMRLIGVPIVIGTYLAVYDIIDDDKNGLIIKHSSEENDIENCSNAILLLAKDKSKRQKMALNARKKSEQFSAKVIAKQWINFFERR